MKPGDRVAIWLYDREAKLFLGLTGERPTSRFAVIGKIVDPAGSPIGPWVEIEHVEERRPEAEGKTKKVLWKFKQTTCLIRWDYMISGQLLAEAEEPEDPRPHPGQYL